MGATHPLVYVDSELLTTQSIKSGYFPPHVTWLAKLTSAPFCSSISASDTCPFLLATWSGVFPDWYGRGVQCRHEYTVRWWGGGRWSIVAWIHHRVNVDVLPYKMQYHTSRGRCLELGGTGEGVGRGQRGEISTFDRLGCQQFWVYRNQWLRPADVLHPHRACNYLFSIYNVEKFV